ncbi:unnamed protein product [Linum trigynum]|uniref:Uncharacterized protein n=1 Tax=Linum trigynum TaxID=586398 RepID=A0AAV2DYC4_9ROSI
MGSYMGGLKLEISAYIRAFEPRNTGEAYHLVKMREEEIRLERGASRGPRVPITVPHEVVATLGPRPLHPPALQNRALPPAGRLVFRHLTPVVMVSATIAMSDLPLAIVVLTTRCLL